MFDLHPILESYFMLWLLSPLGSTQRIEISAKKVKDTREKSGCIKRKLMVVRV
jgi:hypothetical protein